MALTTPLIALFIIGLIPTLTQEPEPRELVEKPQMTVDDDCPRADCAAQSPAAAR